MIKNRVMNRKVVIFSLAVALIGFLCIINSHYLVWCIGDAGKFENFLFFLLLSPLFIMVYLCLGMFCLHESNSWTEKIKKKGRGHFKRLEAMLNLSLKQIFTCGIVYCIVAIVLMAYFDKFCHYSVFGDCLLSGGSSFNSLYTKDGRTIVDGKDYHLDFKNHEDCNLSEYELLDRVRVITRCPGGPYFCYLSKANIDQIYKGRGFDYDKYGDRVYYQYEEYRITYWVDIYNSEGYVDDVVYTYSFFCYPDKKDIDGHKYSYRIGSEYVDSSWNFEKELHKMRDEDLRNYVLHMNDEKQPSSKNEHVHEAKPQTTPQTTTSQPKPQPVPMQVFKKCMSCLGGGQCSPCYGSGVIHYPTGQQFCPVCGGTGRCNICAGRGGEYVVEYH